MIRVAIDRVLQSGINFGASNMPAGFRPVVCQRFAGWDRVRFTNSGTEANLMALATALRLHEAGRSVKLVSVGGYHGGVFYFRHRRQLRSTRRSRLVVAPYNDIERHAGR